MAASMSSILPSFIITDYSLQFTVPPIVWDFWRSPKQQKGEND
jgi:hypothetical protein